MAVKDVDDAKGPKVDLGEFRAVKRISTPCTVGVALKQMTDDQREKLIAAVASQDIPSTAIVRVLKDWGYPFTDATMQRHRRGDCACS